MKKRHSKIKIDKNEATKVRTSFINVLKKNSPKIFALLKVLAVIVIVVSLIFISAKSFANVTMSNITESIKSVFVNFGSGDGYPYEISEDGAIQTENIDSYLAVVESDRLVYLNSTAKEILKFEHNYTEPVLKTRNGRGLFYNRGSKDFVVTAKSELLYTQEDTSKVLKGQIITADIGHRGQLAFATWSDEGVSRVSVFDSSLREKFYYVFSTGRVVDLSVSKNGKFVCAAVIDAENAQLYSRIVVFDVTSSKPVVDKKIVGETAVDVEYISKREISVLTLSSYFYIDSENGEISPGNISFENGIIEEYSFDTESHESSLAISVYGGNSCEVKGFSSSGKEKFSNQVDGVRKITRSDKYTAVLTDSKIYCYKDSGKLKSEISLPVNVDDIQLNGKKMYIFSGNKVYRLKVSKWNEFNPD